MKSNLASLAGFFIAMSGLVSCSPDKPVQDRLDINAPLLVRDRQSMSWDDFLVSARKELDLEDTIEFENAPNANLNVKIKCGIGAEIVTNELALPLQNNLRVSDLLTDRMLAHLSPETEPVCSLEFVARNSAGSTRTFEIQTVRILNKARNRVLKILGSGPEDESSHIIVLANDPKSHLQVEEWSQHDEFRIQCSDVSFRAHTTANSFLTANLELDRPKIETDEQSLNARPGQRCRAFSYLNGKRIRMSDSFTLLYENRMPVLTAQPGALQPDVQALSYNLNFLYRSYELSNRSESNLKIVIPKATAPFDLRLYTGANPSRVGGLHIASKNFPALGYAQLEDTKSVIDESVESWTLELKPGETIKFHLRARIEGRSCQGLAGAHGSAKEPFYIYLKQVAFGEEILLPLLPLDIRERMFWGKKMGVKADSPEEGVISCR